MFLCLFRNCYLESFLCDIRLIFFIHNLKHNLHTLVIVHIVCADFSVICDDLRILASDHMNLISFRYLRKRHFCHVCCNCIQTFHRVKHFFCTFRLIRYRNLRSVDFNFTHRDTVSACLCVYLVKLKTDIFIQFFYCFDRIYFILFCTWLMCDMCDFSPIICFACSRLNCIVCRKY